MFSDSRTRAENFGISIGRHGRGQSRAPLGCRRSESGARRASAPACAVSNRRDHARDSCCLRHQQPRKPRITPATPHRFGRRPSARQCPIGCPNADTTGTTPRNGKSHSHAGFRVARPGLEPGTPRFSVVRSKRSNSGELPANKPGSVRVALGGMFANSILSPPIREMAGDSSPDTTTARPEVRIDVPAPVGLGAPARSWVRRVGGAKRLATAGQQQGDLGADAGAGAGRTVDDQGAGEGRYAVLQASEPATW
jgi:hypothetical protein